MRNFFANIPVGTKFLYNNAIYIKIKAIRLDEGFANAKSAIDESLYFYFDDNKVIDTVKHV